MGTFFNPTGNLFKDFNDTELLEYDLYRINNFFRKNISRGNNKILNLEATLKRSEIKLYRMYRLVTSMKGVKYSVAREAVFEGLKIKGNYLSIS